VCPFFSWFDFVVGCVIFLRLRWFEGGSERVSVCVCVRVSVCVCGWSGGCLCVCCVVSVDVRVARPCGCFLLCMCWPVGCVCLW